MRAAVGGQRSPRTFAERGGALQVVLIILGTLVVLSVVAAAATLWYLKRYVQVDVRNTADGKQVEIETPLGGLKVRQAEDVARKLKLPVYPGAWPDENASVEFWAGDEREQGAFDLTIATFLSDDPLEKVDAWYRQQLGPEFKRDAGRLARSEGGKSHRRIRIRKEIDINDGVAFILEREGRVRGVALEPRFGRVKIALFDVWEGREQ